ncbi:MAG: glycosyltransferase family 39 protein [Anaerolineae bacterium]|nr:glycosyltransferase family 39 protein [Anaerolineae bacterium]
MSGPLSPNEPDSSYHPELNAPGDAPPEHVELVAFDNVTLSELLGLLWRHPRQTLAYTLAVLRPARIIEEDDEDAEVVEAIEDADEDAEAAEAVEVTDRPTEETPPPASQPAAPPPIEAPAPETAPVGARLLWMHALQCAGVMWLCLLLLTAPEAPDVLRLEQTVLILWMIANSLALLVVRRGGPDTALRLSEGSLTVLSMLALLQWADAPAAPAYVAWAGGLGLANLVLGAWLPAGGAGWLTGAWEYTAMLGAWFALVLAAAAGRIMLGADISVRRSPELFYQGIPVLYLGMALWALVAVLVWQRRRVTRWLLEWRAGRTITVRSQPVRRGAPAAPPEDRARIARALSVEPGAIVVTGLAALGVSVLAIVIVGPTFFAGADDLAPGVLAGMFVTLLVVGGSLAFLLTGVRGWRVMTGQAAAVCSLLAYAGSAGNLFTVEGVVAWAASLALWWLVLRAPGAPLPNPRAGWVRWQAWQQNPVIRVNRTLVILTAIMLAGAFFRLNDLEGVPPEMTSDHVEKLLDAARAFGDLGPVHIGPAYTPVPQIFFPNNGGREPLQMYLVAAAARLTGWGFTFNTLKIVSALEGLLTLPLLYWMGKELGSRRAGLLLAGLVAVSFWHTMLSRLALRIVLMPLCMVLLLIYLARMMRHNRRADYLKAGLVLGAGMYAYQGLRMAPLIVLGGVALAVMFTARCRRARRQHIVNLAALVVMALAVFVPMSRVMLESPQDFWRRATGRLGVDEGDAAVADPLRQFLSNYNDALWMFNWKSDVQWISNVPNQPELDPFTGALFALGVAGAAVRMFRRRDPVEVMLVLAFLVMLLPSALSIAQPQENPSATRASGALPVVYLWAALAFDALLVYVEKAFAARAKVLAAVGVVMVIFLGAGVFNHDLLFDAYRYSYAHSADPYTHVGAVVRGFADSLGSMETAYIVAYTHWLDHRAVGINAGDINWANLDKLLAVEDLPQYLPQERTLPLMIMYNQFDTGAADYLADRFPEGVVIYHQVPGNDRAKDFYIMIVPVPPE